MSMSDDGNSIDDQGILAGGVIRGRVGRAAGEGDEYSGVPADVRSDDVRSVDESREQAAGDQDHAAETEDEDEDEDEEDRTQGHT